MNDYRYPILKEIGAEESKNYIHILNTMEYPPLVTESVLMQMKTDGLIQGSLTPHGNVSLSEKGVVMLLQFEQEIHNEANKNAQINAEKQEQAIQDIKNRKKNRRDKIIIGVTSSVLSCLATYIIEHISEIIDFFASLF